MCVCAIVELLFVVTGSGNLLVSMISRWKTIMGVVLRLIGGANALCASGRQSEEGDDRGVNHLVCSFCTRRMAVRSMTVSQIVDLKG